MNKKLGELSIVELKAAMFDSDQRINKERQLQQMVASELQKKLDEETKSSLVQKNTKVKQ